MYTATVVTAEDKTFQIEAEMKRDGSLITARIPLKAIAQPLKYVDFLPDYFTADAGTDGYMISPNNMLTYFKKRDGYTRAAGQQIMPIFGVKTPEKCFVAIITGMPCDAGIVTELKDGKYRIYPRFSFDCSVPYEDMTVEYHYLTGQNADYSGMAREYRAYRLSHGCVPLSERVKNNKALEYTAKAPYIRIRLGWKPVPSPVLEQTVETEPPMKVAVDFRRVGDILDEFKRQGVDKAEICLVGWNVRGHDGRWPQALPVEESLGGEEGLRALIKKAQEMGYQIVCHTNSTDAYRIADCWDEDYIIKRCDGTLSKGGTWSGGSMYEVCPEAAFGLTEKMLTQAEELGFRGTHYIDVMSVVPARRCWDRRHPLNKKQYAEKCREIFRLAAGKFGGISSEGGFDYLSECLDYGLYISFGDVKNLPGGDEYIPLWQLVYNGIILSNPSNGTVNAAIKGPENELETAEFNGRPTFYYYSKFVDETPGRKNWMGDVDLLCGDEKQLTESVAAVKRAYDVYEERSYLQLKFMDKHEILSDRVCRITYSDGSKMIVNRGDDDYIDGYVAVPAKSSRLFKI